jgi:ATPase subunit of ABC transporter with duplicated ATPase domains
VRELTTNPVWEDRTIVVVSHDRFFLDEVCGDVLHVSGVAPRVRVGGAIGMYYIG